MIIYLNNGRNTTAGRVISFLRFPLIVLILFIHSNFSTVSGAFCAADGGHGGIAVRLRDHSACGPLGILLHQRNALFS